MCVQDPFSQIQSHIENPIASKMIYKVLDLPKGALYMHDFNAYYSSPLDGYKTKTVAASGVLSPHSQVFQPVKDP